MTSPKVCRGAARKESLHFEDQQFLVGHVVIAPGFVQPLLEELAALREVAQELIIKTNGLELA